MKCPKCKHRDGAARSGECGYFHTSNSCPMRSTPDGRTPHVEAVKRRPPGSCYCDHDDVSCYNRGHWNPMPARK